MGLMARWSRAERTGKQRRLTSQARNDVSEPLCVFTELHMALNVQRYYHRPQVVALVRLVPLSRAEVGERPVKWGYEYEKCL